MNSSTFTQLLTQKENLVLKMKELLLVNDIYNLQKIKKEYDYLDNKLKHTSKSETSFVRDIADNYSSYVSVGYSNKKINPRYAKYYKDFKTPVQDNNLIIYKSEVKEQCAVEQDHQILKNKKEDRIEVTDIPNQEQEQEQVCEEIGEAEYNNEYAEY